VGLAGLGWAAAEAAALAGAPAARELMAVALYRTAPRAAARALARLDARWLDAEDVASEAFLYAWPRLDAWEPGLGARLSTYAYRGLLIGAYDAARRARRRRAAGGEHARLAACPDRRKGPEDVAAERDGVDLVALVLSAMPPGERAAYSLRHGLDGGPTRSDAEVARVLRISRGLAARLGQAAEIRARACFARPD
jgi:RNA polymerase sigma factor (sigma-70 family)